MNPYEIKSFALTLAPMDNKGSAVLSSSIELPLNTKAFSSNQSRSGNGIHGKNYTIPEELVRILSQAAGLILL